MKNSKEDALVLATAIACVSLGGPFYALPINQEKSAASNSIRSSRIIQAKDACTNEDCAEKTAGCLVYEAGYVLFEYMRASEDKGRSTSKRLQRQYSVIAKSLETFPPETINSCGP